MESGSTVVLGGVGCCSFSVLIKAKVEICERGFKLWVPLLYFCIVYIKQKNCCCFGMPRETKREVSGEKKKEGK